MIRRSCRRKGHDWRVWVYPAPPVSPLAGADRCERCGMVSGEWGLLEAAAQFGGLVRR